MPIPQTHHYHPSDDYDYIKLQNVDYGESWDISLRKIELNVFYTSKLF